MMRDSLTGKRVPDFIIGGAPRSGTTWLYHLLDRHPEVCMARPVKPEPKFFLIDEIYGRGFEYYLDTWFSARTDAAVMGEKSTNYLESAIAARRIRTHLPGVRLVFILREPADRAYSNYLWSRMNGMEGEDFLTALSLEEERERDVPEKLRYARPHAYFSRGLYAAMLRPYLELFPKEQILLLRYEDMLEGPEGLAKRLHHFLGITRRPEDARGLGAINESKKDAGPMPGEARQLLARLYKTPNEELKRLVPDFPIWETQ